MLGLLHKKKKQMELITLYARKWSDGLDKGMAYYKDRACRQLFCVSRYRRIRKSQRQIFNCWPYWCEVVND